MADKFPLANGVWSNAANWNGGTLPLVGDDVYADGKTVTIDQSVTVLTIRTTLRSGGTVGGLFSVLTGGYTITCTDSIRGIYTATTSALTLSHTTGTTIINAIIRAGANNQGGVLINGTGGTTQINGTIFGGNAGSGTSHGVAITTNCTVSIVGNVFGGSSVAVNAGISISSIAIVNITGDISAGSGASCFGISNTSAATTINITGNCIPSSATVAINSNQASTINITGNCTAQAATAISATSATVTVVGTITATNSAVGINVSSCTISTPCINASNGVNAVYASTVKIYASAVASWLFKDELNNNKYLYSAGVALGNPLEADVRDATVYGASNELTGTMIVPSPSDVRISVPTDNTVGTIQLTSVDFLNAILTSSDPIAVRLRNISTVDISNAQMASYN
jgi:hypothetical protein